MVVIANFWSIVLCRAPYLQDKVAESLDKILRRGLGIVVLIKLLLLRDVPLYVRWKVVYAHQ